MIGRAPYGHSAVLRAILAADHRRDPDGEQPACGFVRLDSVEEIADPERACAALDQDGRRPLPEVRRR